MRVIAEIPHPSCKISVFYMNQKYIIKIEQGNVEIGYKISEIDYVVSGLDTIVSIIEKDLLAESLPILDTLKEVLSKALKDY
jgi:hypothetical protein